MNNQPIVKILFPLLLVCSALVGPAIAAPAEDPKPNILFIAVDDLNDWIGCMGGNAQSVTPNFDRLAASGVLFTNAHCAGAACNPSRTAIFTGRSPNVSGMYSNGQNMREIMPDRVILPQYFRNHGYTAMGSGKMLHYFIDAASWDEYFPEKESENPFPRTMYPETRPLNLPRGGPWQYVETDWGGLDATDEEFGGDYLVAEYVGQQLSQEHDKPFFLACGIYRPHEPWFVPQKYFDQFPLEQIQLPPGYREGDIDDLPVAGRATAQNRYFPHILEQGQWKQGIQGYLASIAFADAMLGRVLDALEAGPNADNTIVVLWSDHGWHLGEKEHWQKYTGWRACTRVPLMVRIPAGISSLEAGTIPGTVCDQPVSLVSLYPTLIDLAGLPADEENDGPSLVPLLNDPAGAWGHVAVTHLARRGSFSVSDNDWRYIHYADGGEELYNIKEDPYEWTNLAQAEEHAPQLQVMRDRAPSDFAPKPEPSVQSLIQLTFHPSTGQELPASNLDGSAFDVFFINHTDAPVNLFWIDPQGQQRPYGTLEPGQQRRQRTRPGAVWQVQDEAGKALGHFRITDRSARADIPAEAGTTREDE